MNYTKDDLDRLHAELVDILKEIVRVCTVLKIDYFIQGGTAIGAFFNQGFVPWDDDIDLGMTRDNYKRFIKEAPAILSDRFFIQCFETEELTPFYFIKVRKNNTLFVEYPYKDIPIHHGIFVDIFPFDNVPDSPRVEIIHRRLVQFFEGSFKRRQMYQANLERFSDLPGGIARVMAKTSYAIIRLFPRKLFYWSLHKVQSLFNNKKRKFVSIVKMPLDQISTDSILNCDTIPFEGIQVKAPNQLERYLRHHYPHLQPTLPADQQINHAPYKLSFDTTTNKTDTLF